MAHTNKVLRSIETADGGRCVDTFVRPDATFGFEEYRRDVEDGRGWFPIGFQSDRVFETESAAYDCAMLDVSWLEECVNGRRKGQGAVGDPPRRL